MEDLNGNGRRDGNDPTDSDSDWNRNNGPGEMDPLDPDTDGDHLSDGLEVGLTLPMGTGTASPPWAQPPGGSGGISHGPDADTATRTDPLDTDSDDDGIPDGWVDLDGDGTVDANETEDRDYDGRVAAGAWNGGAGPGETDPTTRDTDSDEWADRDEEDLFGTNPIVADTDADGIRDGREFLTDPLDADTDDDGLKDGTEDRNGDGFRDGDDPADGVSDWADGQGLGETDPIEFDTDGDGLSDGLEIGLASPETGDTDLGVFVADADGGLTKTDPLLPDTDLDGIMDGLEDAVANGIVDPEETDPEAADTDGDGLSDGTEDADRDGILDAGETDPRDADSEPWGGDGMPDGWETTYGLQPLSDDAAGNPDGDGWTNLQEYQNGASPISADTDRDFIPDGSDTRPANYDIDPPAAANLKMGIGVPADFAPDVVAVDDARCLSVAVDSRVPDPAATFTFSSGQRAFSGAGLVGATFRIETSSPQAFTAVVKARYAGSPPEEKQFLLYRWQGGAVGEWAPMKHTYMGEETWRNVTHDYVWGLTTELGDFAIADSLQRDYDGDGWSDGAEFNAAEYDPWVRTLCDTNDAADCGDPGRERPEWGLFESSGGDATLYVRVPVSVGSREAVIATDVGGGSPVLSFRTEAPSAWAESHSEVSTGPDIIVEGDRWAATPFHIPASQGPYRLAAVQVWGNLVDLEPVEVDIRRADAWDTNAGSIGVPGTVISSVVNVAPTSTGFQWLRIPFGSLVDLASDASYYIVVRHPTGWGTWQVSDDTGLWAKYAYSWDGGATWEVHALGAGAYILEVASLPHDVAVKVGSDPTDGYVWTQPGWSGPNGGVPFVADPDAVPADVGGGLGRMNEILDACSGTSCPDIDGHRFIPLQFHSSGRGALVVLGVGVLVEVPAITKQDMVDTDGDGLRDSLENEPSFACLDPMDEDTDGDGLKDGSGPVGERAWDADTDVDGWINACDSDSDGDGLPDGVEAGSGTSPLDGDTDGDAISDGVEDANHDGSKSALESDPRRADSDDDGLSDSEEDIDGDGFYGYLFKTEPDPNDSDSDDDGLLDGDEPSWSADSDGDLVINVQDPDSDDDSLLDGVEVNGGPWTLVYSSTRLLGGKTYMVSHGVATETFTGTEFGAARRYPGSAFDTLTDWVVDASPGDDGDYTLVNVGVEGGGAISGVLSIVDKCSLGVCIQVVVLKVVARPNPLVTDTDHDGLRDGWEVHGADTDGDGNVDVPIQAYGANPVMRDIFVEVDYLPTTMCAAGHGAAACGSAVTRFSVDDQNLVVTSFLRQGIQLKIDSGNMGEGGQEAPPVLPTQNIKFSHGIPDHDHWDEDEDGLADAPSANDDLYDFKYGEDDNFNGVLDSGEDANADGAIDSLFSFSRRLIFHWALFSTVYPEHFDHPTDTWQRACGIGELHVGANDFTVGPRKIDCYRGAADVFMHELGHNLNLPHSGLYSVMREGDPFRPVDYHLEEWRTIIPSVTGSPGFPATDED